MRLLRGPGGPTDKALWSNLASFHADSLFSDLTLVGADKARVKAHRVIMGSISNLLYDALKDDQGLDESGQATILVPGLDGKDIQEFLNDYFKVAVKVTY